MREWLSGRASPCQGERREFESRLPLQIVTSSACYDFFIQYKFSDKKRTTAPLNAIVHIRGRYIVADMITQICNYNITHRCVFVVNFLLTK